MTGGYIGHAVTVANHKVYQGFYGDDPSLALMHGPTFMGNALACNVALKSIELFENEDYMSKISRIAAVTKRELEGFKDSRIKEVRMMGLCLRGSPRTGRFRWFPAVCVCAGSVQPAVFKIYVCHGSLCDTRTRFGNRIKHHESLVWIKIMIDKTNNMANVAGILDSH